MRPVQYFSDEYLEQCKKMKPADILRFLDDFRRLYSPARRRGSRLISLKVPEDLLEAFKRGEDIHSSTASQMFEVPINEVDGEMRRIAKVLNFGVIYGLSAHGISQQTGFSREEGANFIDTYFSKYPGISDYLDRVKAQTRETNYAETLLGRRRYIPEIHSSNFNVRSAAERMAINMPIQGTAADIMKKISSTKLISISGIMSMSSSSSSPRSPSSATTVR